MKCDHNEFWSDGVTWTCSYCGKIVQYLDAQSDEWIDGSPEGLCMTEDGWQ